MRDRGDIVVLAPEGAYTGEPRPWVVRQNGVSDAAALQAVTEAAACGLDL